MRRVLHLVQSPESLAETSFFAPSDATDSAILACRAAIESLRSYEHSVCLIASSAGEFRADSLGLGSTDRVPAPLGLPRLGLSGLRSLLAFRPAPSMVQCWTDSLVPLARMAIRPGTPVLGPVRDLPFPDANASARTEIRKLLDVDDGTPVIGALCDPPRAGDAYRVQFATGLFEICGLHTVALIPAAAGSITRGRRFHREAEVRSRTFYADYPSWTCLPACDAVFLHTPNNGPTRGARDAGGESTERALTLMAHTAGVPVVAPGPRRGTSPFSGSFDATPCDPAFDSCFAPSPKPSDMARAMLVLLERGLPAVRRLGEEFQARVRASGERERRFEVVEASWRAAVRG